MSLIGDISNSFNEIASSSEFSGFTFTNTEEIIKIVDNHFKLFNEDYFAIWIKTPEVASSFIEDPYIQIRILVDVDNSLESFCINQDLEDELLKSTGSIIKVTYLDHQNYGRTISNFIDGVPIMVKNLYEYTKFIDTHKTLRESGNYRYE